MKKAALILLLVLLALPGCAHEGEENAAPEAGGSSGFQLNVIEQFTNFGTILQGSTRESNPLRQYLGSSTTQFSLNYNFDEREGVRLNVPFLFHDYSRPEGGEPAHHSQSGLGDISLVNHYEPYHHDYSGGETIWSVYSGVKLPTGNPDHLLDELTETAAPQSAIHGHDLAFGSGSLDFLTGTALWLKKGDWYLAAGTQYLIRDRGAFGYLYGNSFSWWLSPGIVLSSNARRTIRLQLSTTGESKTIDYFGDIPETDTGGHTIMTGPDLRVDGNRSSLALGVSLPISNYTTGFEAVPSYRVTLTGGWTI